MDECSIEVVVGTEVVLPKEESLQQFELHDDSTDAQIELHEGQAAICALNYQRLESQQTLPIHSINFAVDEFVIDLFDRQVFEGRVYLGSIGGGLQCCLDIAPHTFLKIVPYSQVQGTVGIPSHCGKVKLEQL